MDHKALRERRAKLISDARQTIETFTAKNEALSAEAMERVDKLRAEAKAIGDTLLRADEVEDEERAIVPETQRQPAKAEPRDEPKPVEARNAAVSALLRGDLRPEHRQVLTGESLPPELRTDQSTSSAYGGYTIAPDTRFYGQITEAMKEYGGMMSAPVTVLTTATGATLPIPTDDDTANVGTVVAEAGDHSSGTVVTLGVVNLGAYVVSSKIVKVSAQLIQDSATNFEAFLAKKLGTRVARKLNAYLTVGTGSSEPQGIAYSGASNGRTCATGYTTTCTADDLLRLKHSVDPAYRNANTRWMMNDTSVLNISLLKDGDGQYIWKQGLTEGAPDILLGHRVVVNQDMLTMAAGTRSVAFGDFSYYYVRQVAGIQLVRLAELYAAALQVGFMAWSRFDGVLVDAGTHPVKVMTMAAS